MRELELAEPPLTYKVVVAHPAQYTSAVVAFIVTDDPGIPQSMTLIKLAFLPPAVHTLVDLLGSQRDVADEDEHCEKTHNVATVLQFAPILSFLRTHSRIAGLFRHALRD